MKFLLC